MRELQGARRSLARRIGITPACAGITRPFYPGGDYERDHPRVCGNYNFTRSQAADLWGSPPRVRELLKATIKKQKTKGITPACAGITRGAPSTYSHPEDHPRVCGNYVLDKDCRYCPGGSPPRVRELRRQYPRSRHATGITPACAGITRVKRRGTCGIGDHPRVCGNYPFT